MSSLFNSVNGYISVGVVLETVLLLVVMAMCTSYLYPVLVQRWRIHSALWALHQDPNKHWLYGHYYHIRGKESGHSGKILHWTLKHSKATKLTVVNLGPLYNIVFLLHPDTIRPALGLDPKMPSMYDPLKGWLGDGLLISSGRRWARDRRLLTYGFHFDTLKPYVQIYSDCAEILMDIWSRHDRPFDMVPSIKLYTMDVLLRCICGHYSDCQTGTYTPYFDSVAQLAELANDRVFDLLGRDGVYQYTAKGRQYYRECRVVHRFSMDIIKKRRSELANKEITATDDEETGTTKRRKCLDFIDILLQVKDEDGVGLSDLEIREQIDTFMFEGHDTTANGLCWILYNLARYPQHQQLCRQEVDQIFNSKADIEWDDLSKLTYLKYCIKESLRLFPPVPAAFRQLSETRTFDGHVIHKGTNICLNFYVAHHNSDIWEDPEVFNPLRFTPENSVGRDPVAFLPFSAGSRNCIGQEFAMNELRVTVTHVLRRFELSLDEDHPVELGFLILLYPKTGLFLKLTERKT